MTDDDRSGDGGVSKIADLAREALAVKRVEGSSDIYAVAKDVRLVSEASVRYPGAKSEEFIERHETFTDPRSFALYISEYGGVDTCVLTDANSGRARAVLNYVPKPSRRRVLTKAGVNFYPCTWQADLNLRHTEVWRSLTEFSSLDSLSKEQVYLLVTTLAKHSQTDSAEDELSFGGAGEKQDGDEPRPVEFAEMVFDATYTRQDLLQKVCSDEGQGRWLCEYYVSVFEGAVALPCMLLIEVGEDTTRVQVLDRAGQEHRAAVTALSEVRRILRSSVGGEFVTFEACLADEAE